MVWCTELGVLADPAALLSPLQSSHAPSPSLLLRPPRQLRATLRPAPAAAIMTKAAASGPQTSLEKNFCFYAECVVRGAAQRGAQRGGAALHHANLHLACRRYHWEPVNQWIHITFVPVIFWSAMVMFAHSRTWRRWARQR